MTISSPSINERIAAVRKYGYVLNIAVAERLVYRTDFFLGTLMRFAPIITTIFLWRSVYAGADTEKLGGLTYQNVVAYYLLTMITRAFSSMPNLAGGIARDVREGTVQKYLVQPIDQLNFLLATRMAHKLVYYAVAAVPFILIFYLCRGFFTHAPDAIQIAGGMVSLLLSFFLGFYFEACVGLLAFWFLEISSLMFIVMSLNYFLSGHMVPLELLPASLATAMRALPFQFLAYFPSMVFLGKMGHRELAWGLLIEFGWVVTFVVMSRLLYRRGLRRYSAFGG